MLLGVALTPALMPFHPRVGLFPGGPTWITVSLYSVCVLELSNHIVEDASYKSCANERCHRLFVRHHRDGLAIGSTRLKEQSFVLTAAFAQNYRDSSVVGRRRGSASQAA